MSGFKEFLEDYSEKEKEEREKFHKRLIEGRVSVDEKYPPKSRFNKLKEPVAFPLVPYNIWATVPLHGSTIIPLSSRIDLWKPYGINPRNLDQMIDLANETGRIQFALSDDPIYYKDLEFLEPLFKELNPPFLYCFQEMISPFLREKSYKKYYNEFYDYFCNAFEELYPLIISHAREMESKSLSSSPLVKESISNQFEFASYILRNKKSIGSIQAFLWGNFPEFASSLEVQASTYAILKHIGHGKLVEDMGIEILSDPFKALLELGFLAGLILWPLMDPLKPIYNYDIKSLQMLKNYGIRRNGIPNEIGKFLLEKLVCYPENLNGCIELIQHYDNYEVHKVLEALDEGARNRKIDVIIEKREEVSQILDNIWKDADKLRAKSKIANYGISVSIGLVGELSTGFSGTGILAALGFKTLDSVLSVNTESFSEKTAKFFSPNYLITVYNFKQEHNIR